MNKYEKLFKEIYEATKDGKIVWSQIDRRSHSSIIFNPRFVFRLYEAEFERSENIFTLIIVEKKYDDPDQDFEIERYDPELLILSQGELITTLNTSVINSRDFIRLVEIVELKNDKAKKLFE